MKFLFLLLFLLLGLPVWAQSGSQKSIIPRVIEFYKSVGRKEEARWLQGEYKKGNIKFEKLENGINAQNNPGHPEIAINSNEDFRTFRQLVALSNTLTHERKHANQDPEGWEWAQWKEHFWMGNSYEREAWAAGLRSARAIALELKKQAKSDRFSAQKRSQLAARAVIAASEWEELVNGWKAKENSFGSFDGSEFRDGNGDLISLQDMAEERDRLREEMKGVHQLSDAMNPSLAGTYTGRMDKVNGTFNFKVEKTGEIAIGTMSGSADKSTFRSRLSGKVDQYGQVKGTIKGESRFTQGKGGAIKFAGTFRGSVGGGVGHGTWTAGTKQGTWSVKRSPPKKK